MSQRYYFDYAAATPLDQSVAAAMREVEGMIGNPSSLHAEGRAVRERLEATRATIAKALAVKPAEIVFTGGSTEANNLAIFGSLTAIQYPKGEVVTLATEHLSVRQPLAAVQAQGHTVYNAELDESGRVNVAAFAQLITPHTVLVSLNMATPEVGTVQPLRQISQIIQAERQRRQVAGSQLPLVFHTDASAVLGLLAVSIDRYALDLVTISSAKLYGPSGIGALYVRSGTPLVPLLLGGGQEASRRAGTENVPGAVGLARALALAESQRHSETRRLAALRDQLWTELQDIPGVVCNTSLKYALPNTLNISIPGRDGEDLVLALDARGFAVATGAACAESQRQPSHVLMALGFDQARAQGSLRITLGRQTDESAVRSLAQAIREILA